MKSRTFDPGPGELICTMDGLRTPAVVETCGSGVSAVGWVSTSMGGTVRCSSAVDVAPVVGNTISLGIAVRVSVETRGGAVSAAAPTWHAVRNTSINARGMSRVTFLNLSVSAMR